MDEIPEIQFIPCRGLHEKELERNRDLSEITPPEPASKSMPDWWKGMGDFYTDDEGQIRSTAKSCPGVFDFLRAGYIVRAWADFTFRYDSNDMRNWMAQRSVALEPTAKWHYHPQEQIHGCPMNTTSSSEHPVGSCEHFVKISSPWYLELTEGYSVMFVQPYYRTSPYFTVLPGMMDPCIDEISNKELNIFLQLNIPNTDIIIRKGDPLVQIIPFRRENFKYKVKNDYSKEEEKKYRLLNVDRQTRMYGPESSVQALKYNRMNNNKNYDAK